MVLFASRSLVPDAKINIPLSAKIIKLHTLKTKLAQNGQLFSLNQFRYRHIACQMNKWTVGVLVAVIGLLQHVVFCIISKENLLIIYTINYSVYR